MDIKTSLRWASPYPAAWVLAFALAAVLVYLLLRRVAGRPAAASRRAGLIALRLVVLAAVSLVLLNPVRVAETPGSIERPRVVYLVDASQSMALGRGASRWDQVQKAIGQAGRANDRRAGADVRVYRFGSRLVAAAAPGSSPGAARAPDQPPPAPVDADTQLGGSLEALATQIVQAPPQAVVVFSDGRARDAERAGAIAPGYARMNAPIHVFPVGDEEVGGDVAIVSMVVPAQARKDSLVAAQVFLRSYGYRGRRADLKIVVVAPDGTPGAVLARMPVTLDDGLSSATLTFSSGDQDRRIEARIDPQPGEVSAGNNAFAADLAIDHTKIRVLYVEGTVERLGFAQALMPQRLSVGGAAAQRAYSPIQQALMEDPDIECTVVVPGRAGDFSVLTRPGDVERGLPDNRSELFAYDAILLSNVPHDAFSDKQMGWVEEWVGHRGAGICLAGGPFGFASGRWNGSAVDRMLPVALLPAGSDWDGAEAAVRPVAGRAGALHPIWHIVADEARNRALLRQPARFAGHNRLGRAKPGAEVLASFEATPGSDGSPAIAVQPFGRGRAMAVATEIARGPSAEFVRAWGEQGDARYYKKFWRNVVYWLTENSSIGRRRLLAETDKRIYRPGEPVVIRARTFDENAAETIDYRVAVSVEPRSAAEIASDDSPLHRPAGPGEAASGTRGPLLPWGEEFTLPPVPAEKRYTATLPLAESRSLPPGTSATQGLRIELTAYENNTQVDSTALEVQVLDDPTELQNPLPDHALLRQLAARSGGTVLSNAGDLASLLANLPRVSAPPEVKQSPAWSGWGLLLLILTLLTAEWVVRRRLGLA